MATKSHPAEARAPRDTMLILGRLRAIDTAESWTIRIRNLSATGLMADAVTGVEQDMRYGLDIRGIGRIDATLLWVRDGRMGMAFATPIDPRQSRRPTANWNDDYTRGVAAAVGPRPTDAA